MARATTLTKPAADLAYLCRALKAPSLADAYWFPWRA